MALGAYLSHRLTDRYINFWKSPDGSISYKGAVLIYLIYLTGLVTRLVLEVVFIASSSLVLSKVSLRRVRPKSLPQCSLTCCSRSIPGSGWGGTSGSSRGRDG